MNDYGLFQALAQLVREDPILGQRITDVVTEPKPGMIAPYLEVHFEKADVDIPCLPQVALVTCELQVVSTYHGDQEIHELMSRLDFRLNGTVLPVQIAALRAQGIAVCKSLDQKTNRLPDLSKRVGKLRYQIRINIRRN